MSRPIALIALSAILCGMNISKAAEEGEFSPWSLSILGGTLDYEGDFIVEKGDVLSFLLGYTLNDQWRLEGGVHVLSTLQEDIRFDVASGQEVSRLEEKAGVNGTHGMSYSLETLRRLGKPSRLDPHLAFGVGLLDYDTKFDNSSGLTVRAGAGFQFHLNDAFGLRAEVRAVMNGSNAEMNGEYSAGIIWTPAVSHSGLSGNDRDGDGLSDADERRIHGTDPHNPDTDFDGLSDGQEVLETETDPLKADTDGGGVSDGHETLYDHTDPSRREDDAKVMEPAIAFAEDGAEIREEYFSELDIVGRVLSQGSFKHIVVESHVFAGTSDQNQDLSQKRAEAIMKYLQAKWKLSDDSISAKGYGESSPRGKDVSANDRIEIYAR